MDVVLCLIAMVPASVIMLITALFIKLDDGGPVFFRQERVTRNGKHFNVIKFRSMIVDAEKYNKPIPAVDQDPRITKVGRIIRATRIDELPQLFNILKGDMSIVGPRPERVEHVEKYSREIPEFIYREKVKGGLQKLDGLSYKVKGKASHDGTTVTGIILNSEKHILKLENIKVKLVGKVIGNFN